MIERVGLDDFGTVASGAALTPDDIDTELAYSWPTCRLDVRTPRELCAMPDPVRDDELLGPLVVKGQRVVIGGHTGEGKSTFTLAVVRAIVNGENFLGFSGVGGVRALVIDAEQGLRSIKRRLREAGLDDCFAVDYVSAPGGLALDSKQEDIAEVERILASGHHDLVAADPLYKLHAGDSNDERSAVNLMRRFDSWRTRYGFAFLLPVHCRKPIPRTPFSIHDIFGSSAYVRGAEVVLGVQRVRPGYSRLSFLKDRDGDLPIGERWGLLFSRERGYTLDPATRKPSTRDQLAGLRAADPAITQQRAAEAIGCTLRTVERHWKETAPDAQENLLEEEAE